MCSRRSPGISARSRPPKRDASGPHRAINTILRARVIRTKIIRTKIIRTKIIPRRPVVPPEHSNEYNKMKINRALACHAAIGIALIAGALYAGNEALPAAGRRTPAPPEDTTDGRRLPAEQLYKNIKLLKGISGHDLSSVMEFYCASLGVHCGYCHVHEDFSSDDKPAKNTARSMIQMTNEINEKHFSVVTVTCNTCHRGSPQPMPVPALAHDAAGWPRLDAMEPSAFKHDSSTTADAVLDRYAAALGGTAAIAKIRTRVIEGTVVQAEEPGAKLEVQYRAPGSVRIRHTASDPKHPSTLRWYDGAAAGMIYGTYPPFALANEDRDKLAAGGEIFPVLSQRSLYSSLRLLGRERIGDTNLIVVSGTRGQSVDRLYFDAGSGLLLRRAVEYQMFFGAIPYAIEYADYRKVDGVLVPHRITWVTANESLTEKVTSMKQNVPLSDTLFAKPH